MHYDLMQRKSVEILVHLTFNKTNCLIHWLEIYPRYPPF